MKRTAAILMILFLMAGVCMTAFADPVTHTITVENSVKDETYKVYKIFDVSYSGELGTPSNQRTEDEASSHEPDNSHEHSAYAYTINTTAGTAGAAWWDVITDDDDKAVIVANKDFYANGLHFTLTTTENVWNVEMVPTAKTVTAVGGEKNVAAFDAAAFAALLHDNIPASVVSSPDGTGTGNGKTGAEALKITVANDGYYFVTTTLGSLCSLNTTEPNAIIVEKNAVPSVDKNGSDTDSGYGKEADAGIGRTVYFKTDITDGVGTDSAITLHDTMSAGLTLDRKSATVGADTVDTTFNITVGGTEVPQKQTVTVAGTPTERVNYTIKYKGDAGMKDAECTFEIVFSADYIKALPDSSVITVKYTATLNKDAEVFNAEIAEQRKYNTNKTKIDYSNQTSPEVEVRVYTYDMSIVKTDVSDNRLAGAKFTLTKSGEANPIRFIKVSDNVYRAVTAEEDTAANASKISAEVTSTATGVVKLVGLDAGVYALTETKAPDGYNPLTQPSTVVIGTYTDNVKDGNTITTYKQGHLYTDNTLTTLFRPTLKGTETLEDTVEVENRSGNELPSTGGIGTIVLYCAGALMILAAVVLLVIKRRKV